MKEATCDICGKEMSAYGLAGHKRFKHGINTKPHDQVSPEEVVSLRDSMKTKEALIVSLEDSLKTRDAEFATLHDEIATLNDKNKYLESNEYLSFYLHKLTPEAYDQLGVSLFPERTRFEDSKPETTQGGATAARGAHNAEVASSTLAPATIPEITAPVADVKPQESSIVFHEVTDPGWTWYPALGYSIKN